MRHQRTGKKLGRDSAHRKALYANLTGALIEHGRIKTTETKAKAVKPIAEQMITLGRRGDIHARRQAVAFLRSKDIVHKLFAEVGAALRRAARRLHAHRQARPAPGRRRRDGLPRARRHAARLQDEARGRCPTDERPRQPRRAEPEADGRGRRRPRRRPTTPSPRPTRSPRPRARSRGGRDRAEPEPPRPRPAERRGCAPRPSPRATSRRRGRRRLSPRAVAPSAALTATITAAGERDRRERGREARR